MLFFHFCCNESFCYCGSVCNISIKSIKRRQLYNSIVFLQYSIVSTWDSKHLFFTCFIAPLLHPKILDILILLLISNSQTPKIKSMRLFPMSKWGYFTLNNCTGFWSNWLILRLEMKLKMFNYKQKVRSTYLILMNVRWLWYSDSICVKNNT